MAYQGEINTFNYTSLFLLELSKECLSGTDQATILQSCEEKSNSLFTEEVKDLIIGVIQQHPSSLFKGYSKEEYNQLS